MPFFKRKSNTTPTLNIFQRKFARYKSARDSAYQLNLENLHITSTAGLVSMILPTCNSGNTINDCIDSVLAQTYRDFELIIVDNGSTDNTRAVLKREATLDKRIRLILNSRDSESMQSQLMQAFAEAKGEFVTVIPTSDIMTDDYLEKMVAELDRDKNLGAVSAVVQLIDARGKPCKQSPHPEANPAFICRAIVAKTIDIPANLANDSDCAAQINLNFQTHTVTSGESLMLRRSNGEVAEMPEESEKNDAESVREDFRRDFFLSPLVWYVDASEELEFQTFAQEFKDTAFRAGHVVTTREDVEIMAFGKPCRCFAYVNFGGVETSPKLPDGAVEFRISSALTCETPDGVKFAADDCQTLFSYLNAKAKNLILAEIELEERVPTKKVSLILCAYRKSETLIKSLHSLCEQAMDRADFEIIFVNNDYKNMWFAKAFDIFAREYKGVDLKYISAPIAGLSHARNVGMNAASGEILLFIDDVAIAPRNWAEMMYSTFTQNPEFGIIGGQSLLTSIEPAPRDFEDGLDFLWDEFKILGNEFRAAESSDELPTISNFGIRADCLRKIGGFRTTYEKVGGEIPNGDEAAVCYSADKLGFGVGLCPQSSVELHVDAAKFTLAYIENATISRILAQFRIQQDLYAPQIWHIETVGERLLKIDEELRQLPENTPKFAQKYAEKQAFIKVWEMLQEES